MLADEVVDLAALGKRRADVAAAEISEPPAGPSRRDDVFGDILRIGAHIERCRRAAPDLPRRVRRAQLVEEPRLLFGAENRLRRIVLANVRDLLIAEPDGRRRLAAVVVAPAVEDLEHVFRGEL